LYVIYQYLLILQSIFEFFGISSPQHLSIDKVSSQARVEEEQAGSNCSEKP
jgi:FMN-dependent NADH-azoreductase